jgi:hypothetical protein
MSIEQTRGFRSILAAMKLSKRTEYGRAVVHWARLWPAHYVQSRSGPAGTFAEQLLESILRPPRWIP